MLELYGLSEAQQEEVGVHVVCGEKVVIIVVVGLLLGVCLVPLKRLQVRGCPPRSVWGWMAFSVFFGGGGHGGGGGDDNVAAAAAAGG